MTERGNPVKPACWSNSLVDHRRFAQRGKPRFEAVGDGSWSVTRAGTGSRRQSPAILLKYNS